MADDKVTSIFGGPVQSGEPSEIVISALEDALADARAGEICGIGLVTIAAGYEASYRIVGWRMESYAAVGAASAMITRLASVANPDEPEQ